MAAVNDIVTHLVHWRGEVDHPMACQRQAGMFGRRFAIRFAPTTFVVATSGATAVALLVLGGAEMDEAHGHCGGMAWLLLVPVELIAFVIPPPIEADGAAPVASDRGYRPCPETQQLQALSCRRCASPP